MAIEVKVSAFCSPDNGALLINGVEKDFTYEDGNASAIFMYDGKWFKFPRGTHKWSIIRTLPDILGTADEKELQFYAKNYSNDLIETLYKFTNLGRIWTNFYGINIISFWADSASLDMLDGIYEYISDGDRMVCESYNDSYANSYGYYDDYDNPENWVNEKKDYKFIGDLCNEMHLDLNKTYLAIGNKCMPASIVTDYGFQISPEDAKELGKAQMFHALNTGEDNKVAKMARNLQFTKFRQNRDEKNQKEKYNYVPSKTEAEYRFMTSMDENKQYKHNKNMRIRLNENDIKRIVKNVLMEMTSQNSANAQGVAQRKAAQGDGAGTSLFVKQGENGKASRNRITGKRVKTAADYAKQAQRLGQISRERADKEADSNAEHKKNLHRTSIRQNGWQPKSEEELSKMYPGSERGKNSYERRAAEETRRQAREGKGWQNPRFAKK